MSNFKYIIMIFFMCVSAFALENLKVGSSTRTMIVYAPSGIEKNRPLIIQMHGAGQGADYQQNASGWSAIADTGRFVVVFPNGVNKMWDISGTSDTDFLKAIINEMYSRYGIDKNRVYASGFSMGGMMSYHAANKMADQIAAIAPVSGYPIGTPAPASVRPMPILHIHGTADEVVLYNNAVNYLAKWRTWNSCPSTSVVTKPYPAGKSASAAYMEYWGPCNNSEVRLLSITGKGHWYSMDLASVNSSDEIWNFVKRFSLNGSEITPIPEEIVEPTNRDSIFNGGFDSSTVAWTLNVFAGTAAGIVDNGKYKLNIESIGTKNYQIQLIQHNLRLEKDQWYEISFDAYASAARSLEVNMEQHNDPWTSYLTEVQNFDLTTNPKTYSFSFQMTAATDTNSRLSFNAGSAAVTLYLDNVILKKIEAPVEELPSGFSDRVDLENVKVHYADEKLRLDLPSTSSVAVLSIFDLHGNELMRQSLDQSGSFSIDLQNLRNGTYLARVHLGHNGIRSVKFNKVK